MKHTVTTIISSLYGLIAKKVFFIATMAFFLLHTIWIAVTSHLLPYDEYYHIGIIRFYADKWSPFIHTQPSDMSLYGDVTRLPSYIFHYLMSFPYRALDYFIENELVVLVLLRFFNIAMVVGGIILFRRLFLRAGISVRIVHFCIALFVALPIVPLLAAQNNYDNLLFLVTPIFLFYAYQLIRHTPTVYNLLAFGIFGMLATLMKHNFMAVFVAVSFYVGAVLLRRYRVGLWKVLKENSGVAGRRSLIVMAVMFLLVGGLFIERHGVNALRYGQIKVDCAKVQPEVVCEQFSPWRRNRAAIEKDFAAENRYSNPASFSIHWVTTIMRAYHAVFANIVPEDLQRPDPYGHYVFKALLPLPIAVTYTVFAVGIAATVLKIRYIWQNKLLRLSVVSFIALSGALWIFNYTFYLKYGRAYAIQARYLLPLTIPFLVVCTGAISQLLQAKPKIKQLLAVLVLAVVLYTGGAVGWIIRSEPDWYLPNTFALEVNTAAKSVLQKIIWH